MIITSDLIPLRGYFKFTQKLLAAAFLSSETQGVMSPFRHVFCAFILLFGSAALPASMSELTTPQRLLNWVKEPMVQKGLGKARNLILDGQGLEKALELFELPLKSELYQALFQEPLDGAVARFLELVEKQEIEKASRLYDSVLIPAYHYRFFLHSVLQGTPLKEAVSHFRDLDPLLKDALTDESDKKQICHYARVRMGIRRDSTAFFRLKGVHYAFSRSYEMVSSGLPLQRALEPLRHPEGSFRRAVLSTEINRVRVKRYLGYCKEGDSEAERGEWTTLVLLWASEEVKAGEELAKIFAQVGSFSPDHGVGFLLGHSNQPQRVSALYRALALNKFRVAPQFFNMELVLNWARKGASLLRSGIPAKKVANEVFGLDSRFPIYRVLTQDAYHEELIKFYEDIADGRGFYESFEELAALCEYRVPELLKEDKPRTPQELAEFRSKYRKESVLKMLPRKKGPEIPQTTQTYLPSDPSKDKLNLVGAEGVVFSNPGRFLELKIPGVERKLRKRKILAKVKTKSKSKPKGRDSVTLGPVGPFPLDHPLIQKQKPRRKEKNFLSLLKRALRKFR